MHFVLKLAYSVNELIPDFISIMVSSQFTHFLLLLSIGATSMFIAILVVYELAPIKDRRKALKNYAPFLVALGAIIALGAVVHK